MTAFAFRRVVLAGMAALLAACASIQTGSHYDESADFGAYRTFAWIDEQPYVVDGTSPRISPLTQAKIERAIVAELERKGYAFVAQREGADFAIAYTVGTRERIRVDAYPPAFRVYRGWHIYGGYVEVYEPRAHAYTEGTLGVDVFDNRSRKPVWHGWAEKTITESDRKDPTAAIGRAVGELLARFPR